MSPWILRCSCVGFLSVARSDSFVSPKDQRPTCGYQFGGIIRDILDVPTGSHIRCFVTEVNVRPFPRPNTAIESTAVSSMTPGAIAGTEASQGASAAGMDKCSCCAQQTMLRCSQLTSL